MELPTILSAALLLLLTLGSVQGEIIPADASKNISWPYHKYKTANFTPPLLEISHSTSLSEGYLFFSPNGATAFQVAPIIADSNGELVYNGPIGLKAFGFGVQRYKGERVLVAWNGSSFPEPIGRGNGYVTLQNKHYDLVANVTLPGNFLELQPNATFPSNIDLHEIYITDKNTMLVLGNNVTNADLTSVGGPKNGWVVEAQVYEIDIASIEILWSWKSLDHLDELPFTASVYPRGSEGQTGQSQETAWGYFHINSVASLKDGYIISSRYLSSAIALEKSGKVEWRVQGIHGNGFTLGKDADFRYQHDIRVVSESRKCVTLKMHDNHNCPIDNGTVPASGKILKVDLESKHVSLVARYYNQSGPVYPTAQGNFQRMGNGHYFTGDGWVPVMEEFSSTGTPLATIQFGNATKRPGGGFLSGSRGTLSYRSFKQPWIGCPRTKPAVFAEYIGSSSAAIGTRLYISWNGATEVDAWKIYGGIETVSYIVTVPKKGFETVVDIAVVQFAQVKPVWRHGTPEDCRSNVASELVFTKPASGM